MIVANHPFGIGDGIAVLALAEQLDRPYRILANSDFLKVPEIRHLALPIDFSETREAVKTNLASRSLARRLLREGVTIVVFPAGGVATAEHPAGKAEELPWKAFTARLIQQAEAAVLPVYFEGQNSPLFHLVSRYSLTVRLALMVSELRNFVGATVPVHVGRRSAVRRPRLQDRPAGADRRTLCAGPSAGAGGTAPPARGATAAAARGTAAVSLGSTAATRVGGGVIFTTLPCRGRVGLPKAVRGGG